LLPSRVDHEVEQLLDLGLKPGFFCDRAGWCSDSDVSGNGGLEPERRIGVARQFKYPRSVKLGIELPGSRPVKNAQPMKFDRILLARSLIAPDARRRRRAARVAAGVERSPRSKASPSIVPRTRPENLVIPDRSIDTVTVTSPTSVGSGTKAYGRDRHSALPQGALDFRGRGASTSRRISGGGARYNGSTVVSEPINKNLSGEREDLRPRIGRRSDQHGTPRSRGAISTRK